MEQFLIPVLTAVIGLVGGLAVARIRARSQRRIEESKIEANQKINLSNLALEIAKLEFENAQKEGKQSYSSIAAHWAVIRALMEEHGSDIKRSDLPHIVKAISQNYGRLCWDERAKERFGSFEELIEAVRANPSLVAERDLENILRYLKASVASKESHKNESDLRVIGNSDPFEPVMIEQVVESYLDYLSIVYPAHYELFKKRENTEGARAEAVVFSILRGLLFGLKNPDVRILEDPDKGGVDFLCQYDQGEFIVEVTSLDSESVKRKSGISDSPNGGGAFSLISDKLLSKTKKKAKQVAGHLCPRVVAITSEYFGAALLGGLPAESFFHSDPMIAVPLNKSGTGLKQSFQSTDLRMSPFLRVKGGEVQAVRKSISAVLLVTIIPGECEIVGVLHPEPRYPFDISVMPRVPFLRLEQWPLSGRTINTEWVTASPEPGKSYCRLITLTNDELKGNRR